MTFQDIMDFYGENEEIFREMQENFGHIIPFVGAGLSCDYGYPLWGNFLWQLNEMLHSPSDAVREQIDRGACIEASQELEQKLGLRRIYRKMVKVFSAEQMQKKQKTAAGVLPYLFPEGPVITANYDQVLETLYAARRRDFSGVLLPYNRSMTAGTIQRDAHMLLKLHGQVCGDLVDDEAIVFTKNQYEKAYAADTDLVQALKGFAASHILLFLGCSLTVDQTVTLLREFSSANRFHYAILPCAPEQIDERLRQLEEGPHIRAILYPAGQHEAVRILLEELLQRTRLEEYNKYRAVVPQFRKDRNRFVYRAENIRFFGREAEQQALEQFCADERPVLWWTVSGAGGAGKSRLAYEFRKAQSQKGWATVSLRQKEYDLLSSQYGSGWIERNTLFIADYVQGHMDQIGSWISDLEQSCLPGKVRVLLLERDGTCAEDSPWMGGLKKSVSRGDLFQQDCYKKTWLHLEPMPEDILRQIMAEFCENVKNQRLSQQDLDTLYDALLEVDPTLRRPLFALFVADASIDQGSPKKWDADTTMDWIYEGECRLIRESLRDSRELSDPGSLEDDVLKLYCAATVYRELSLDGLKQLCPTVWENFRSLLPGRREDKAKKLLREIGLMDNSGQLLPMEPDLLGEYFVLRQLEELDPADSPVPGELVGNFHIYEVLFFFLRSLIDYPEKLRKQDWLIPALLNTKFSEDEWNTRTPVIHIMLLTCLSKIQEAKQYERTVMLLRNIQKEHPDFREVTEWYARALFFLFDMQTGGNREEVLFLLRDLHESHPHVATVTQIYAVELCQWITESEAKNIKKLFEMAKKLQNECPKEEVTGETYAAAGLFLTAEEPERKNEIMEKVSSFVDTYPDNELIQLVYSKLTQ